MNINEINNTDIIFTTRALAVPYNYRISYKVTVLCMIIGKCCGRKGCSDIKLQMITAALNSSDGRKQLLNLTNQISLTELQLVRFDPAISRAINFALADKLIFRQGNGLFRLKDKGKELVSDIYKHSELMIVEKDFIKDLSNKLTEEIIENISQDWRSNND